MNVSKVLIAGVGMTPFGKQLQRGLRNLAVAAIDEALADAGVPAADVDRVFFANAAAGIVTQQEMIRGSADTPTILKAGNTNTRSEIRCCKYCSYGKPCGDTCIAANKTCRAGRGCAC